MNKQEIDEYHIATIIVNAVNELVDADQSDHDASVVAVIARALELASNKRLMPLESIFY